MNTVRLWPVEYNVYAGGERTIIRPNGNRELVMSNHHGSTACIFPLTGLNRTPIAQQVTDAYGVPVTLQGAVAPQRSQTSFIGRDVDKESDLGAFGARLYSSECGRFVAVDKLREEYADITPYHYSNNLPILGIDPTGLGVNEVNAAGRKAQPHVIALWNEAVTILYETGVAHELVGTLVADGEAAKLIHKCGAAGSTSIAIFTTTEKMDDPLIARFIGHVHTHNNPIKEGCRDTVEGVPPGFQDVMSTIETAQVYGSAAARVVNFVASGKVTFAYEITDPSKANTIDPDKLEEV